MNISSKIKVFAIAIILLACCNHADARRPLRHYINRTARVAVVHTPIHRHIVTSRVINRFSQKNDWHWRWHILKTAPILPSSNMSK